MNKNKKHVIERECGCKILTFKSRRGGGITKLWCDKHRKKGYRW